MFDVTNFLMRWLFLGNLVRDVAEIQTLPYSPNHQLHDAISHPVSCEEEWRDNCLRGILSYPSGTQRTLVMDAMRAELVKRLSISLREADKTLRLYEAAQRCQKEEQEMVPELIQKLDPFMEADMEIINTFVKESQENVAIEAGSKEEALLIASPNRTRSAEAVETQQPKACTQEKVKETLVIPSPQQVEDAQTTIRTVRSYLPQLVSILLKSPPAFEPNLLNPINRLRQMIIERCVEDANWGVDMCWLLEAEVGRAWKKLFEHRQQTGKRLIVVLPAEKAAVIAKIGMERKEAFDMLQDTEQATAYGYTPMLDQSLTQQQVHTEDSEYSQSVLPSSISLRRCSHFGDTMHLIDRLSKVSMELQRIPAIHRHVSPPFSSVCNI